jgi:hypothetical protein
VVLFPSPDARVGLTELEAWGPGETPLSRVEESAENLAWNPGDREFPQILASFSGSSTPAEQAIDGRVALTRYSPNRWTAQGSPNAEDWLELDFGNPVELSRVDILFLGDGGRLAPPEAIRVERWTGESWSEVSLLQVEPRVPTAWALNEVGFDPVRTRRLRVVFVHAPSKFTGVAELRVWPS